MWWRSLLSAPSALREEVEKKKKKQEKQLREVNIGPPYYCIVDLIIIHVTNRLGVPVVTSYHLMFLFFRLHPLCHCLFTNR